MRQINKLFIILCFSLVSFIPVSVNGEEIDIFFNGQENVNEEDQEKVCNPLSFYNLALLLSSEEEEKKNICDVFPDLNWMQVQDLLGDDWQLRKHPHNSQWLKIWPTQTQNPDTTQYSILSVVSKKSKSYIMALKQLLDVLKQQDIDTSITLININKKQSLVEKSVNYAEKNDYDLIFSMGSQSAAILHANYADGKIPIVTSTNKDPVLLGQIDSYTDTRKSNIAYTSLNVPLSIQAEYIKMLKPNLKTIGLMYNKNHKQVMATEVKPTKKEFQKNNINVLDIIVESTETAPEKLADAIPATIKKMKVLDPSLKNTVFLITSSTAIFSHIDVVNQYTENIPVIANIPNAVIEGKNSAVIAFGIDRRSNAHQAALYSIDILKNNVKAGSLPVGIVTPPDISINFLVAKKIGLKIPFKYFENANFIYDYNGKVVRDFGENVGKSQ